MYGNRPRSSSSSSNPLFNDRRGGNRTESRVQRFQMTMDIETRRTTDLRGNVETNAQMREIEAFPEEVGPQMFNQFARGTLAGVRLEPMVRERPAQLIQQDGGYDEDFVAEAVNEQILRIENNHQLPDSPVEPLSAREPASPVSPTDRFLDMMSLSLRERNLELFANLANIKQAMEDLDIESNDCKRDINNCMNGIDQLRYHYRLSAEMYNECKRYNRTLQDMIRELDEVYIHEKNQKISDLDKRVGEKIKQTNYEAVLRGFLNTHQRNLIRKEVLPYGLDTVNVSSDIQTKDIDVAAMHFSSALDLNGEVMDEIWNKMLPASAGFENELVSWFRAKSTEYHSSGKLNVHDVPTIQCPLKDIQRQWCHFLMILNQVPMHLRMEVAAKGGEVSVLRQMKSQFASQIQITDKVVRNIVHETSDLILQMFTRMVLYYQYFNLYIPMNPLRLGNGCLELKPFLFENVCFAEAHSIMRKKTIPSELDQFRSYCKVYTFLMKLGEQGVLFPREDRDLDPESGFFEANYQRFFLELRRPSLNPLLGWLESIHQMNESTNSSHNWVDLDETLSLAMQNYNYQVDKLVVVEFMVQGRNELASAISSVSNIVGTIEKDNLRLEDPSTWITRYLAYKIPVQQCVFQIPANIRVFVNLWASVFRDRLDSSITDRLSGLDPLEIDLFTEEIELRSVDGRSSTKLQISRYDKSRRLVEIENLENRQRRPRAEENRDRE